MMQKKLSIKELHDRLLEIAIAFHNICEKNKIPYYMLGGTMLGAVRHSGFIPWDDDMDFGVMEHDIPKLIKVLSKELPTFYKLRDVKNSDYISNLALKIEDLRYEIVEEEKENLKEKMGIYIDIFPLSRTNANKSFFSRNGLSEILLRLNWSRFLNYRKRGYAKYACSQFIKFVFFLFPKNFIPELVNKFLVPHKGDCITNYWGAWINKEIVPANVMGKPTLYDYENVRLYGVENYDKYLKALYKNYLELPPENKRHTHIKEVRER